MRQGTLSLSWKVSLHEAVKHLHMWIVPSLWLLFCDHDHIPYLCLQLPYSDDLLVPCFPTLLYAQHLGTTFVAFSWRCDIFCIYGFYNECHHNWWYRRSWIFLHNPHTLAVGFGVGFGISIKVALYRSRFLKQTRSNIKAPNMQPTHTHTLIQLEDSTIISVASVLFSTTWSPPPSPPPSPPEPKASPAMVTTISLS